MLWNVAYETGIPVMDEQHKELFRQMDILLDAGKQDRVKSTLDFLAAYVMKHFSTEEGMHVQACYPKSAYHKELHVKFIATYKDLRGQYDAAPDNPMIVMKLSRVILDWLKEHIRAEDKEFAKFYLAKKG